VRIVYNGAEREVADGVTIAGLLVELAPRGPVAVEANQQLVPRERHAEWVLREGDVLEVVTLVGGG
jgi:sulfur carrier protein